MTKLEVLELLQYYLDCANRGMATEQIQELLEVDIAQEKKIQLEILEVQTKPREPRR